ncbi:DUF4189 domain-containing protein [Lysobacter capsici]|uniref:DUF4189 domain-containing protein n=1 Tax=Lysobacter capsici TaxID=435897 RepID=UPI0009E9AE63
MYRSLALVGALSLSGIAVAQSCPSGIPSAGNPVCIPPGQSNSPYYQSGGASVSTTAVKWETRWGAFAIDMKTGLGTSKGMRSKRAAQNAAISACRNKGGQSCKIQLAYFNQCGVIVQGEAGFNVASAETLERATEIGMKGCSAAGDRNCTVYFSECSPAELVR